MGTMGRSPSKIRARLGGPGPNFCRFCPADEPAQLYNYGSRYGYLVADPRNSFLVETADLIFHWAHKRNLLQGVNSNRVQGHKSMGPRAKGDPFCC